MTTAEQVDQTSLEEIEATVECVEKVRAQYPDEFYQRLVTKIVQEQEKEYDRHIARKRGEYNSISNFKDRQVYYNTTLKSREGAYAGLKQEIKTYLLNPIPRSYEHWLTPLAYAYMKAHGYRHTIEYYVRHGYIIKR